MTDTEATLRAELAARITFQEGVLSTWATGPARPPAIEATARAHSGNAWFDIAVCRVLLGDAAGAATAFSAAAGSLHAALEVTPAPSVATYSAALESAVLSGDRGLATALAGTPVDPGQRPALVGDRLAWALALPALVTGDDGAVKAQADAANAVAEKKAWYPGLGAALAAVVAGDGAGLAAALDRVLTQHATYARTKRSWCYNSGPCLLCVPAAALVRLAGWRGVAVPPVPARRATVPLALVHTTQPPQDLPIEVDFLPDAVTTG